MARESSGGASKLPVTCYYSWLGFAKGTRCYTFGPALRIPNIKNMGQEFGSRDAKNMREKDLGVVLFATAQDASTGQQSTRYEDAPPISDARGDACASFGCAAQPAQSGPTLMHHA